VHWATLNRIFLAITSLFLGLQLLVDQGNVGWGIVVLLLCVYAVVMTILSWGRDKRDLRAALAKLDREERRPPSLGASADQATFEAPASRPEK
jgi:hypothetical protein